MIPIGLALLFLTGVGPLLAWRKTSADSLKRNFGWPAIVGVVSAAILGILGYRDPYSLICFFLSFFFFWAIAGDFSRGPKALPPRPVVSMLIAPHHLHGQNPRRYGGYVVHFGM